MHPIEAVQVRGGGVDDGQVAPGSVERGTERGPVAGFEIGAKMQPVGRTDGGRAENDLGEAGPGHGVGAEVQRGGAREFIGAEVGCALGGSGRAPEILGRGGGEAGVAGRARGGEPAVAEGRGGEARVGEALGRIEREPGVAEFPPVGEMVEVVLVDERGVDLTMFLQALVLILNTFQSLTSCSVY